MYAYLYWPILLHFICPSVNIKMTSLQVLPFYNLNDREFNIENGAWSFQLNQLIEIDVFNLISNPDKFDEVDADLMVTTPKSTYYSAETVTT